MNRGSEWRRWELHLHTPFTQKNDCYRGSSPEEKWRRFYEAIRNYIGDGSDPLRTICAIAITDYLSIDNYLKVRNDMRRATVFPACVKLVFPNVELRMTPPATKSPINIHCLFSPDVADSLNDRFFAQLHFGEYSATKSELMRLGRKYSFSESLSDEKAYATGLNQFVVSLDNLKEVFENAPDLRQKTIIIVSNKSTDGVSGVMRAHEDYFADNVSSLDATIRGIYQFADMVFSSNSRDIDYFLGKSKSDNVETVKRKYGSLKPCVHGCDAHEYSKIFEPDEKRYCWIKADPTFEGLKQVLYEPEERVRISSVMPETKPDYYVIDHVQINDSDFSPSPIYFSDKLTCIIGGKSTGKSTLLRNIAASIDAKQVLEKEEQAPTNVKQLLDVSVAWRDGVISEPDSHRKIIYIPQTYLNRLSDKKEETTEIDQIIEKIVLQDVKCYEAYQQLRKALFQESQKVVEALVEFVMLIVEMKSIVEQKHDIGDPDAISNEIQKLKDRSTELAQAYGLAQDYGITEDELQEYQSDCEQLSNFQSQDKVLQQDAEYISHIESVVGLLSHSQLSADIKEDFDKEVHLVKQAADELWQKRRSVLLSKIENDRKNNLASQESLTAVVSNLRPKIEGNAQLKETSAALSREQEKLSKLSSLDLEYKWRFDKYSILLSTLCSTFNNFNQSYEEYVRTVNDNLSGTQKLGDLECAVKRAFHAGQFCGKLEELLDRRGMSRLSKLNIFDSEKISERSLSESDVTKENLSNFIKALVREDIRFKSEYTIETGLRALLTDWNHVDYIVRMDGDEIQKMSPGKKALVLLRLLISLAESKCPILIDQPEDDLDNRSIYEELVGFIREKKKERQIITVTHNANIVLGSDAELVIVANQNIETDNTQQHRFEYRGGSIEDNNPVRVNGQVVPGILNEKGIQEHICEILEGGKEAFTLRQEKYHFIES